MTKKELLSMDTVERVILIEHGLYLDVFADDPNGVIRDMAAKQCCRLAKDIEDEWNSTYQEYVDNGWSEDDLECKHNWIRNVVIGQIYGLNKFVNNKDHVVRITVARQGYGLDKLVNDENEYVRAEVARQGYGLDKLVNDESELVRKIVAEIKCTVSDKKNETDCK